MSQMNNNNTIDINLYDRQVRTYGIDAVTKMASSSILIVGLEKGLGTEIGKNLALGGVKNIYLLDNNLINDSDLETGFYYTSADIGYVRSKVLALKLRELNPYVNVESVNTIDMNQGVTIFVNQELEYVKEMSNFCRSNNSKVVVLYSKGISGVIFVDAGSKHTVNDVTSENIEPVQIGSISIDGTVKCVPNSRHDFQSGDIITFNNLEGESLSFLEKEWKIKVINPVTFILDNFESQPFRFINGTAVHIKKPVTVNHQTFSEQLLKPTINSSLEESNKIINTYIKLFTNNIYLQAPFIWSEDNIKFMETHNIDLPKYGRLFNTEIILVVSLMGSLTASEAIKLITGKYMPINQWFTWSDSNLIPEFKPTDYSNLTTYGILYGRSLEERLVNSKWLLVGSGAIGCEHLKNLAFMNVADGKLGNGQIIITDPDSIERSNLNRQFLFRPEHIGKSKSETASNVIKLLKSDINIMPSVQRVGPDNTNFTDSILSKDITGVINALDNISARRFMDEQCFKYNLPLFESGTTGTKGNTQTVIPFITETYSASSDPEQEKTFPLCTIKSFPNEIHHTIHWAMDQFEFFNRAPTTMNQWLNNSSYLDEIKQVERSIAISDINLFTTKYKTQLEGITTCIRWAIDMFMENYNYGIHQLLETHKPDEEIEPGVLFWSNGKRCPRPITIDYNNDNHLDYIEATTHLLARCSGINDNISRDEIKSFVSKVNPVLDEKVVQENDTVLLKDSRLFKPIYTSQEFEKDDDTNWHINWITSASNLRALNYGIPIADKQTTKGIAGRIIPAIATTTSAVSGLILLEMLKYLINFSEINKYRSTFINLAEPTIVYSEPISAPMIDIAGIKVNSWTKFTYTKDSTLREFKKYYEDVFKIVITMVVVDVSIVYADFLSDTILDKKISEIIKDMFETGEKILTVSLACDDDSKDLPQITISLN